MPLNREKIAGRVCELVAEVKAWLKEDCEEKEVICFGTSFPLENFIKDFTLIARLEEEFEIAPISSDHWKLVRTIGDITDFVVVMLRSKALLAC